MDPGTSKRRAREQSNEYRNQDSLFSCFANTILGPLAWGQRRRGGDSSDNIQIDSYHMAATGTGSSSSSSHISKANSDKQQLRQPRATAANSSSKQ